MTTPRQYRLRTASNFSRWAWFILLAVIVAFSATMLTGCNSPAATSTGATWEPSVWRDTETGCEYLSPRDARAITPRMDRAGKQICK